ncbi:50S ribosomal protein L23 [bacterium]|nr:MAG: 50S ribosomal protein L23 [bacterium]
MKDPRKIIVHPLLTEKINKAVEKENTYTFKVARDASKEDIRRSIEDLFKVHVTDVRTANYLGKPKTRGRTTGRRSSWKKAMIKLAPGESISIFEGL